MKNAFSIFETKMAGKVAKVRISGYIGERWNAELEKYQSTADVLNDFLQGEAKGADVIEVTLNSRGGSVPDGVEMYEALRAHGGRIVVDVVGSAFSVASVILLAGDERRISTMGQVMIHRPALSAYGNSDELKTAAEFVEKLETQVLDFYTERTGQKREELSAAMKKTTFYTANEAIKLGFCTGLLTGKAAEMTTEADPKMDAAQEALMGKLGWRLPFEAAAIFGTETPPRETENKEPQMNIELVTKLKGIFGADMALDLASKNPEAKGLQDFETQLSERVKTLVEREGTLTAELNAATTGKTQAEARVSALEAQLKDAGKAPVVVTMQGDPSTPPRKPEAKGPPAEMQGPAKAEWYFQNDAKLRGEFGSLEALKAYMQARNWDLA